MNFFDLIEYKIIPNEKGDIYKLMSSSNCPNFVKGDIYFSEVKPNIIKNWRKHKVLNCIIGVVAGEIEIKLKSSLNQKSITARHKSTPTPTPFLLYVSPLSRVSLILSAHHLQHLHVRGVA